MKAKLFEGECLVKINSVVIDTATCHEVIITVDMDAKVIKEVFLHSNFVFTDNSSLEWIDESNYGVCFYICEPKEFKDIAKAIKDKEWFISKRDRKSEYVEIHEDDKNKILEMLNKIRKK